MSSPDPRPARRTLTPAALLGLALLLGACGFQPLYGTGTAPVGSAAEGMAVPAALASIEVATIPDRSGQILRTALVERLSPAGRPRDPAYRLSIGLSTSTVGLGISRDDVATRANLRATASYSLVRKADGEEVTRGSLTTIASYNILADPFVTITAERDAEERALLRLADNLRTQLSLYLVSLPREDEEEDGDERGEPRTPAQR